MKIDREEEIVIWKDFKLEHENKPINIGPFYFEWANYERVINDTFGIIEKQ